MVPEFLIEGIAVPDGTIPEQLAAAQALVPDQLLMDSGQVDELRQCADLSYYHFWMNALQHVGIWAEAHGRDAELPAEFWVRIAQAAYDMKFPEFIPYCLGKSRGLPARDPADVMAAFATLPELNGLGDDLRAASRRAAGLLRQDSPEAGPLLDRGDLAGLAAHLRSGAYDRVGEELSTLFSEAFDELFDYVTDADFPEEHQAHFWAVAGPNQFMVALGEEGTLFSLMTFAQVWWRAD